MGHYLEYLKHKGIKVNISLDPKNRCKPKLKKPYRLDVKYKTYKKVLCLTNKL